jgi:hypothetical protein
MAERRFSSRLDSRACSYKWSGVLSRLDGIENGMVWVWFWYIFVESRDPLFPFVTPLCGSYFVILNSI